MADLLRLLSDLHDAVTRHGVVRLAITHVEDFDGMVDHHTGTIHICPDIGLARTLAVIADGVAALTPAVDAVETGGQLAVGGGDGDVTVPTGRHLRVVPRA